MKTWIIHGPASGDFFLSQVNGLVAGRGANIKAQSYNTRSGIGYPIMDVEQSLARIVEKQMELIATNIRTRLLF
jgi:hypothetical protein